MQHAMTVYFDGEKNAGLLLAVLGLLSLAAAATFFPARWGLRSFAITMAIFAIIEIGIGVGLYARTDAQVRALVLQMGTDVGRFVAEETARMTRVQRNFAAIQYVELAVLFAAAILAVGFKTRPAVSGVALALVLHAAVLLAFDVVADRRGAAYLAHVREFGVTSALP